MMGMPGVDVIDDGAKTGRIGPKRKAVRMYELASAHPHDVDVVVDEPFPRGVLQSVVITEE